MQTERSSTERAVAAGELMQRAPEIIERWETRVREAIPASRGQRQLVLRNNLVSFLGEVACALAPTGERPELIEGMTLSEDHGGHRALLREYDISAVFLEYRVLRQTIIEVLEEDGPLTREQREVVNTALEQAVQEAVSRFANVQQTTERGRTEEAHRLASELRTLYERERRIAQALQRPLIQKVREDLVEGLRLGTFYEAARSEALVGGDFFDVLPLTGGRVALTIGDTCGKGLEAAVHNTQVKDVLRAFLREGPASPGSILTRLNAVVWDVISQDPEDDGRFVVVALLIIDPSSGEASYSSAGAEPLLIVRAAGGAETVERPALPLGIEQQTQYEETSLTLNPGDTAALLTDGLTEARTDGGVLGFPSVAEALRLALRHGSLKEAGESVIATARDFAEGRLSDDVCLVLAQRT